MHPKYFLFDLFLCSEYVPIATRNAVSLKMLLNLSYIQTMSREYCTDMKNSAKHIKIVSISCIYVHTLKMSEQANDTDSTMLKTQWIQNGLNLFS